MNIQESFDFLNFWINKFTGAWYTIPELDLIVNRAQLSLFEDLSPQYATSQRVKDALSPFREKYTFTPLTSANGVVTVTNPDFVTLLDIQVTFTDANNVSNYVSVKLYNEDEMSFRLMSQIDPVTSEFPIGEAITLSQYQLYPKVGYTGSVRYFRKPQQLATVYTVVGGRIIVIDELLSPQLEWAENWQNAVLMKALSSIGINIGEQDILQYAELKNQSNFVSQNMV